MPAAPAVVMLPSGRFASDSAYLQQGDDLVLVAPDGTTVVVRGYFLLDNPPDLVSPEGGRMTAAMVRSFTPPETAGQYALAGDQLAQVVRRQVSPPPLPQSVGHRKQPRVVVDQHPGRAAQ